MCFDKNEKMKKTLLDLLEIPEIQHKIRLIAEKTNQVEDKAVSHDFAPSMPDQESSKMKNENKNLKERNQQLNEEVDKIRKESSKKTDQIKDLQLQIASLRSENVKYAEKIRQLESCVKRANSMEEELTKFKRSNQEYQDIYDLYLSLPNALKKALKGIFNENDLWSFIICGMQTDRLLEFWDFCMRDLKRGKLLDEKDKLAEIFCFFLEKINHTLNDTPLYLYQEVKKGAAFDTAQHTATSDSAAVGRIQEVLFPGLVYASSKKILRKSVVVVED